MVSECGDRGPGSAAKDLRVVELRMARIGSGHKNASDGIPSAASESALAFLEEPWILMQNRRKNSSNHEILDEAIASRGPVSLSKSAPALAVFSTLKKFGRV